MSHFNPSQELQAIRSKAKEMENKEQVIHALKAVIKDLEQNIISVEQAFNVLPLMLNAEVSLKRKSVG